LAVALSLLTLLIAAEWWTMLAAGKLAAMTGVDYTIYMEATRRWLAGDPLYPPSQIAGPFVVESGAVLYPPQMLVLFVPFSFLPGVLWIILPTVITAWIVVGHRPRLWAWVAIAALVAVFPWSFLVYPSGTPTIWLVTFAALGTRWRAAYALVWCKPTMLPFALLGARRRQWWLVSAAVAGLGLVMLPLTMDWIRTMLNARGVGLSYSLENVPVMAIPVIAWVGRSRFRPASTSG
jgi:hypothetical protein